MLSIGHGDSYEPAFVFQSGEHEILNGSVKLRVDQVLRICYLDRIEVPANLRRNGEMERMIAFLVDEAIHQNFIIKAHILPDRTIHEDDIAEGMVRVFGRNGFKALKMDGEVYRKDVSFTPPKFKKISR